MNRRKGLAFTAFPITLSFSLLLTFSLYVYSHRQAIFIEVAWDGNVSLMKVMLAIGADVNSHSCPYRTCLTPIESAAWTGRNDAVRFLLERGADVNAASHNGTTALMAAAYHGHVETVKLLLAAGSNPNAERDGDTALKFAKEERHMEIVELLRAAGAKDSD